jgi:hypothetical protein
VIEFITGHIIHRFGIPQTLTTDQGTSFIFKEVREFVDSDGIKLLNSSPYYAAGNGQSRVYQQNFGKAHQEENFLG